jgi:molybdopterin converting factor small subunit
MRWKRRVSEVVKVFVPSPLLSYTGRREVNACGGTLAEALRDLDRQYPGIRFRMIDEQDRVRPHMRIFVAGEQVFALERALNDADVVQVVQALSGG